MNTIEDLKSAAAALQRQDPHSPEAKEAQRNYQAALNESARAERVERHASERAEKKAREKELDFGRAEARKSASLSLGVFQDFATSNGFAATLARWQQKSYVMVGYVHHDAYDGSRLCESDEKFPCKIVSLGRGSYVTNQPQGFAGWHLIAEIEVPEELWHATELV